MAMMAFDVIFKYRYLLASVVVPCSQSQWLKLWDQRNNFTPFFTTVNSSLLRPIICSFCILMSLWNSLDSYTHWVYNHAKIAWFLSKYMLWDLDQAMKCPSILGNKIFSISCSLNASVTAIDWVKLLISVIEDIVDFDKEGAIRWDKQQSCRKPRLCNSPNRFVNPK